MTREEEIQIAIDAYGVDSKTAHYLSQGIRWSDANPPRWVRDLVEVLEVVKARHEAVGGDARKMGIPLGIYTICCRALDEYKKGLGVAEQIILEKDRRFK